VANGALVAINLRARHQVAFIRLNGRSLDQLAVDARVEGNVDKQAFLGQRLIGYGHRYVAKMEPSQHRGRQKDDSDDDSQEKSAHIRDDLQWSSS
jgi:hypothetical protein